MRRRHREFMIAIAFNIAGYLGVTYTITITKIESVLQYSGHLKNITMHTPVIVCL